MGSDQVRNVVLVGHSGSGKTSLAESLLFAAGATNRMGRVEDGNTVTDFDPEEIARGSSVSLAMAPFEWNSHRINLIDTPGLSDFVGEVRAAMRAADLALFAVSGVDGVEVQTEAIWRIAEDEGIARAFFINKLDRERASHSRTLEQLKEAFGTAIAPLQVPIGAEHELAGGEVRRAVGIGAVDRQLHRARDVDRGDGEVARVARVVLQVLAVQQQRHGVASGLHLLGAAEVVCSPLPLARGMIATAHGAFPLPAPATVAVLRGFPVIDGHSEFELTTPTGAAVCATLVDGYGPTETTTFATTYEVGPGPLDTPTVPIGTPPVSTPRSSPCSQLNSTNLSASTVIS